MLSKKDLYKTSEYWVEELQNEIFRQVMNYMQKNDLNQNELANKWGVSKGYISQILSGNCNFSLKKLVELSLALEKIPIVKYMPINVYDQIEKISSYMTEQMNKPLIINASSKIIPIRHDMPLASTPVNPKSFSDEELKVA